MEITQAILVVFQPHSKKKKKFLIFLYFSHRLQNGCLLHCGPLWVAGAQTVPRGFYHKVQESLFQHLNHLLPLLLHLAWCLQGCLSFSAAVAQLFSPSLGYVITGALLPLLFNSALVSGESVLEASGSGSPWHGGSFWKLTEANLVAPLLPNWYRSPELDVALQVWPHRCWAEGSDHLLLLVFNTLCNAAGDFCSKIQASFFQWGKFRVEPIVHIHVHINSFNMKVFPWHMHCSGYMTSSCSEVKFKYLVFWRWLYWAYLDYLRIS